MAFAIRLKFFRQLEKLFQFGKKSRHVLHMLLIGSFMLPFLVRRNEKPAVCRPRNQTILFDKICGIEHMEAAKACTAVRISCCRKCICSVLRQCSVVSCLLSQILYDELVRQSFAPETGSTRSHLTLLAHVRVWFVKAVVPIHMTRQNSRAPYL
jgi:hypothetical protein